MNPLTHFDAQGQAHMVDVSKKTPTHRVAVAEGRIRMRPETFARLAGTGPVGQAVGGFAGTSAKGDVLGVARIAGIQAAKRTSELIPLCHPLPLTRVTVDFEPEADASAVLCRCTTETVGVTGVEMEALTAVQVALLTLYDMLKAVDRGMVIGDVRLMEKRGGKSGDYRAAGVG